MSEGFWEGSGKIWDGCWLVDDLEPLLGVEGMAEKVELLERVLEGCTGPRERRDAAKSGSDASRDIAVTHIRMSTCSIAIRHDVRIHSSFVPLACDWGCTVGPGAVGWPAGGERAGGPLEVGGGGTR